MSDGARPIAPAPPRQVIEITNSFYVLRRKLPNAARLGGGEQIGGTLEVASQEL